MLHVSLQLQAKSSQLPAGACNPLSPPPGALQATVPDPRWELLPPALVSLLLWAPSLPQRLREADAELLLLPSFGSEVQGRGRGESAECHGEGGEEGVAVSRGSLRTAPGLTFLTHSKRRTAST